MRLSLIVAAARNGVIGRDNALPWRLPGDLKRFKEITMGKPLIMGRRTFDSIGRPLPGRTNIVLSRDPAFRVDGVEKAGDFSTARALAMDAARLASVTEIMVIGGAGIYQLALPLADRIYLTEIHADVPGDALFPAYEKADWVEQSRAFQTAAPGESSDYSFVILDRKAVTV